MTTTRQIAAEIQKKLESLSLPRISIKCFGVVRINVHVVCKSRDTADKWAAILASSFKGKVTVTETFIEAKENKGTVLRPTMINAWRIAVISA